MLYVITLRALDWAIISLSFFNMIALLWLGLTVLLNAERRTGGTWVAGGGLILCGLFFIGHTAVVGRTIDTFDVEIGFWWRLSWLMTIAAPFLWYLGTLWYTGALQTWRHRLGLILAGVFGIVGLWRLTSDPLPSYRDVATRAPVALMTIRSIPATLAYPLYSALCIGLAIAAFYHPQASDRFMGDLARRRARPWLVAASTLLIAISLLFGGVMAWLLRQVQQQPEALFVLRRSPRLMALDLLLLVLVAVGTVLTGQAIVSYEIFTGKTLPRGGLRRYWRRSLMLAAGYGALVGLSLALPNIDTIYKMLLAAVLMTLFYALLSWRSYAEREQSMDRLRPFVASQHLYDQLIQPGAAPPDGDIVKPFAALCADVLNARLAYLAPLGSLAPLAGPTLAYPHAATTPPLNGLAHDLPSPQTMCVPLDPESYGGAIWAVPLWSERGLIGALLLGPKRDDRLYTQEEIELARTISERLLDTQASAELARRLMSLQRQRLAESQVIDHRTRRILHDDVLPQLHTALLLLGAADQHVSTRHEAMALISDGHRQLANLLHDMPPPTTSEVTRRGLLGALRHIVAGDLASAFDGVTWQIDPQAEQLSLTIPSLTAEVILFAAREAIRNAARYGRSGNPAGLLHLRIAVCRRDGLHIEIEDDGEGFSTATQSGGSGQGLALHGTMMAVVGGTLTAERIGESYTRVTLALPEQVCTPASAQSQESYA